MKQELANAIATVIISLFCAAAFFVLTLFGMLCDKLRQPNCDVCQRWCSMKEVSRRPHPGSEAYFLGMTFCSTFDVEYTCNYCRHRMTKVVETPNSDC